MIIENSETCYFAWAANMELRGFLARLNHAIQRAVNGVDHAGILIQRDLRCTAETFLAGQNLSRCTAIGVRQIHGCCTKIFVFRVRARSLLSSFVKYLRNRRLPYTVESRSVMEPYP